MAVFVDAAFANNRDLSSQIGFIIALMDDEGAANIVHYSSQKSKRVTRSALAAELYAMMNGFDTAAALKVSLDQLDLNEDAAAKRYGTAVAGSDDLPRAAVPMVIYTDSRSLYDGLVSLNTTTEKRLLIDLHLLRQAYERREIAEVCWIPTEQNPADALTKEKPTPAMSQLLQGTLKLTPNAWVERLEPPAWAQKGQKQMLPRGSDSGATLARRSKMQGNELGRKATADGRGSKQQ